MTPHRTTKVMLEFGGKVGIVVEDGASTCAGVAGQTAGVGVPAPVQETTLQLLKPAPGTSWIREPSPIPGPKLLYVTV